MAAMTASADTLRRRPPPLCCCIVKPNALASANELIAAFVSRGCVVLERREERLTKATASLLYSDYPNRKRQRELVSYMSSGPVVLLLLKGSGDSIVRTCRRLVVGPSLKGKAARGSLRHRFSDWSDPKLKNGVHASETHAAALREAALLFPGWCRRNITARELANPSGLSIGLARLLRVGKDLFGGAIAADAQAYSWTSDAEVPERWYVSLVSHGRILSCTAEGEGRVWVLKSERDEEFAILQERRRDASEGACRGTRGGAVAAAARACAARRRRSAAREAVSSSSSLSLSSK